MRYPIITPWGEELYPEDFPDLKPEPKDCCEPDECPDCGRFLPDCECDFEREDARCCFQCGNPVLSCRCYDIEED